MNRLATVIALCGLALGGALSTHRGPDQEDPSAVAFGIVTAVVDGDTVRVKERAGSWANPPARRQRSRTGP